MSNSARLHATGSALSLLICTVAAAYGCSSTSAPGEDAGVDGHADSQPVWLSFVPEDTGQAGDVWLRLGAIDQVGQSFVLQVVADALGAYGVAGQLIFDAPTLTLDGIEAGDALAGPGVSLVARGVGRADRVLFGVSRRGTPREDAVLDHSLVIAALRLSWRVPGSTTIRFDPARSRVLDARLQERQVSRWLGGVLSVTAP